MNPYDNTRTTGGSSGGDGALIASNSVNLSISTDIGGSIRFPAIFNGVCGFKPSNNRVSDIGKLGPGPKHGHVHSTILSSVGPIGKSVNDLKLFMIS